jgi:hypothetical protein
MTQISVSIKLLLLTIRIKGYDAWVSSILNRSRVIKQYELLILLQVFASYTGSFHSC